VSPLHEVEHRQHGESKSPCEWLSSDNWEEAVSEGGCEEAILEATKLVARDPALAVAQIFFGDGRHIGLLDKEGDELSSLLPGWTKLSHGLLVKCNIGRPSFRIRRIEIIKLLQLLERVVAIVQITSTERHFFNK
tara:strand:+ start:273 stop:677 length:405 start_codon:yes stop_codon:yes gene_type:complete